MAHYRQLDVIPIYESMGITMSIVSGMVFFDESHLYNSVQLSHIVFAGLLIVAGIAVVGLKNSAKSKANNRETSLFSQEYKETIETVSIELVSDVMEM